MTRDELLLAALAVGESTTAALVRATGVGERNCRYGLDRLIAAGYAWSPQRGCWRLTAAGQAIASELPGLPAPDPPDVPSIALPMADGRTATAEEAAALASLPGGPSGVPASLWWTLAGIAAAAVLALARRSSTSPPSAPPAAPPAIRPYDGWPI